MHAHAKKLIRQPAHDKHVRPFMVIWETTMACDLACVHCRAEAINQQDPKRLSTAEGKMLLDQIKTFGKPTPIVVFTGGDPFKREDLFELVAYGTEIGLPIAVSPSATPLLNKDNLQKARDAGAKAMSLSLDGSTAQKHDTLRGVDGSYQMTLDGWKAAQEVGLRVQINTTVTRYNLHDLPAILKLVRERNVMTWSVFFLVPTGRGLVKDEITPEEYEDVMNWLYDASRYIRVKTTEGHHFKRVVVQRTILDEHGDDPVAAMGLGDTYASLRAELDQYAAESLLPLDAAPVRRTPLNINAGNGFVFVSRRGDVFPSGFMPVSGGNVREQSVVDIYRDAPLFRNLRTTELLQGRCGHCEFQSVCSGSRSRAYAVTGNPNAEEPFCTYEPGSFAYPDDVQSYLSLN